MQAAVTQDTSCVVIARAKYPGSLSGMPLNIWLASPPAPTKTPAPTKYYNVSCHNCKYKYDGAWHSSGKVPAGSQITISGTTDSTEAYFDGSPSSVNRHFTSPHSGSSGKWVFTYTYTVNSDTDVTFSGVVN